MTIKLTPRELKLLVGTKHKKPDGEAVTSLSDLFNGKRNPKEKAK